MTDDLRPRVLSWLQETGYPFELRVGRLFQGHGWHVNYSRRYQDAGTTKSRDLDVQAIVAGVRRHEASVSFSLCMECKSSRKPWVALDSGETLGERGADTFAIGSLSRVTLRGAEREGLTPPMLLPAHTPRVGAVLRALTKPGSNASGGAFVALRQAQRAALALDRQHTTLARELHPNFNALAVFVPCVVVDTRLLCFSVAADMTESLEEVPAVVASVPDDVEGTSALVPVLTADYAATLARTAHATAHEFCVAMLPYAPTVVAGLKLDRLSAP